jgi:hypothetical protein
MLHTDIEHLVPEMQPLVRQALSEMNADERLTKLGATSVVISETLRELSVQMAYYSRGRMTQIEDIKAMYKAAGLYTISSVEATQPITWTLQSNHATGHAVDLVPTIKGVAWWRAPEEVWNIMGEIGEKHGLKWGGRWPGRQKDSPHYEMKGD